MGENIKGLKRATNLTLAALIAIAAFSGGASASQCECDHKCAPNTSAPPISRRIDMIEELQEMRRAPKMVQLPLGDNWHNKHYTVC